MLDPALQAFVGAQSEAEADRHLESTLESITPLLGAIAARKLGSYGPVSSFRAEDIEDVVGDAVLVLVERLRELRTGGEASPIESLESYAATVAYSLCARRHRLRHPERARLKNRLRYVLGRDSRFALWDVPGEGLHCGLARWRSRKPDPSARARLSEIARDEARWPKSWRSPPDVDRADPAPLTGEIFDEAGGPIELEELVSLVASVWRIDRIPPRDSFERLDRVAAADLAPEVAIDRKRFAERLWAEIQELPLRQRMALLLNLRDARGAAMLWVFPAVGVASLRAIAGALELSLEEFSRLWGRLPIDDHAIAERLGCERQQVINLRMSARKRLTNRLGTPDAPLGNDSRARGNIGRASTSLAGKP
jgi:RNA polymerase sigma factor (sigma-70 family)